MIWLSYRLQLLPLEQCRDSLTDTEWQYAQTLGAKRIRQFCNGRALIRRLLQHQHSVSNADIAITLPTDKAPVLSVCGERWQLSVSHSAQAIAVAISRSNRLGLDIEQLKPRNIAEFGREYPALAGAEHIAGFYQRWTAAEAYSKYSGEPLWAVLQQPLPAAPAFYHLPLNGYMLCLCYQDAAPPLITTEEIL